RDYLLNHTSKTFPKDQLFIPNAHHVDQQFVNSNRNNKVLHSLSRLYNQGRLAHTGYLSILPVDQGIEHTAGAAFAPNPMYFDPEDIVKLAVEAECNAVACMFGARAISFRKYGHNIPLIVIMIL